MIELLKRAWAAVGIMVLVILTAALATGLITAKLVAEDYEERGQIGIDVWYGLDQAIVAVEMRLDEVEAKLDRLQRVALTEFRSQGAAWVDKLFPQFEEAR